MTTTYIIVSYNSYSDICILLESISRQVVQPQYIIIVDNMSPNGDYIRLKTLENDQIHVVDSGRNGGFGYACNIGIQYAKTLGATHIGLINPDATLTDIHYLEKIQHIWETSTYQILGTYVVSAHTQHIEFGGADIGTYTLLPYIRQRGIAYTDRTDRDTIVDTDYATGSSLFFTMDLYDRVGGFNESYFMYFEETDYCTRARSIGYRIGIYSGTYIDHATSSSVGRMSSLYVRCMICNFLRYAYHHARWYQIPGFLVVYIGYWVPGFLYKYVQYRFFR